MATRVDIQTALDLIRFVNLINDFLDGMVKIIDGEIKNQDGTDMTLEQKKLSVIQTLIASKSYYNLITAFLAKNISSVDDGLAALTVTKQSIIDDLNLFNTKIAEFETMINTVTTKEELDVISASKKSAIASLNLVRNK